MSIEKAIKILLPAVRQHQHNDCSGLIRAYDYDTVNEKVAKIIEQRPETRPHESIVIGEIESHIKSMMIEADEHAKMGNYAKALSLKEQTTGFKRAIDVIRKHRTK